MSVPLKLVNCTFDETSKIITTPSEEYEVHPEGLGHLFFKSMKEHSGKVLQLDIDTGEVQTYDQIYTRSIRTAIWMKSMGIQPGDMVTIYADNDLEYGVVFVAIALVGAVNTALDPIQSLSDCEDLLKQIVPKLIFVSKSCEENIEKLLKTLNMHSKVVVFGETERNIRFSKILEPKDGEDVFEPYVCKDLDEMCFIKFSSGTTGLPKGICWSHRFIIYHTRMPFPVRWLSYANLFWNGTAQGFVQVLRSGGVRATAKQFNPEIVFDKIREHQIVYLTLSPSMCIRLVESKPEGDISILKGLGVVGAGTSTEFMLKIRETFAKMIVIMPFAQTETGQLFDNLEAKSLSKPQSVGIPLANVTYKIVDLETEENLGFNQPGELRVKSDWFCAGYYKRDSSDMWDSEGFFRSGDIFYFDEDFSFFCVDRIKEMFKFRNYHISPTKYEGLMMSHPEVDMCAIIGVPDARDTYHVCAVVLPKPGSKVTGEELEEFYNNKVLDQCRIRAGVKLVESMPLTPSGKIARRLVKEMVFEGMKKC